MHTTFSISPSETTTVSTRIILPSPFYDLPFPRRANFLVACGCPLLFALNRIARKQPRFLILAWTRGRESFKEGSSFSVYVCVCLCVHVLECCTYILIRILTISRLIYGCSGKLYRNNNTVCRLFFVRHIWVNINMPCSYFIFMKLQTCSKIRYSNNFSM